MEVKKKKLVDKVVIYQRRNKIDLIKNYLSNTKWSLKYAIYVM